MKQIIVNCENLQTRIALVEDGNIEEYFIEGDDSTQIVGSIFKGRIQNLESSLQAGFIDIGLAKNAFLHYWDMIPATKDMLEDESDSYPDDSPDDDLEASDPGESGESGENGDNADNSVSPSEEKKSSSFPMRLKELFLGKKSTPSEEPVSEESRPTEKPQDRRRGNAPNRRGGGRGNSGGGRGNSGGGRGNSGGGRGNSGGGRGNSGRGRGGRGGRRGDSQRKQVEVADIPKLFKVNSEVVVQVTKGMIGEKGPRVTTNLSIPGRYLVLCPRSPYRGVSKRIEDRRERQRLREILNNFTLPNGIGCICRTAAVSLDAEALQEDLDMLLEKWREVEENIRSSKPPRTVYREPNLLQRLIRDLISEDINEVIVDSRETHKETQLYVKELLKKDRIAVKLYDNPTPIFQFYELGRQIQNIFSRKVELPSGAELCVDETEALIAIDVNSGKSRAGKDHPETILNINLEAASAMARQLRLRNIGGLIVIDFIDMRSRKDRQQVYERFKAQLERDRAKTKVLPISRLGLLELTRQREHASLQDTTFEPCEYCSGKGLVKSALTVSSEIQRRLQELLRRTRGKTAIRVTVHPSILSRLKYQDAEFLKTMENEYGGNLQFRSDPALHQERFFITDVSTGKRL